MRPLRVAAEAAAVPEVGARGGRCSRGNRSDACGTGRGADAGSNGGAPVVAASSAAGLGDGNVGGMGLRVAGSPVQVGATGSGWEGGATMVSWDAIAAAQSFGVLRKCDGVW